MSGGEVFNRKPSHVFAHIFCSRQCFGKWHAQHERGKRNPAWKGGKITRTCEVCGKEFKVFPCRSNARFCSNECRAVVAVLAFKGKHLSKETKRKLRESMKRRWRDPSYREKMSRILTGRKFSDEAKEKMTSLWEDKEYVQHVLEGMQKKWSDPEYRNKMLRLLERRNKDPEFVRKRIRALIKKPNKPERKLIRICRKHNLPFRYCGDGRIVIGTKNPDFIHKDGKKKVIEVFGRTYHDPSISFKNEIPWHQQYWGRIAYYAQHGYDCLILWDDELSDEATVVEKINSFVRNC